MKLNNLVSLVEHHRFSAVVWAKRINDFNHINESDFKYRAKAWLEVTPEVDTSEVERVISSRFADYVMFEDLEESSRSVYGYSYTLFGLVVWHYYEEIGRSKRGEIYVELTSGSRGVFDLVNSIQNEFDRLSKTRSDLLQMKAYWKSGPGASRSTTNIPCLKWQTIRENYTDATRGGIDLILESITSGSPPGRLIIWSGSPGTGKTWAIKSLMTELKDAYDPIFISDPNVFLEDSSYYYEVVRDHDKPCLFILEDSAEGILKDRRVWGHRISKLLNLTDGLTSRGRGDLFLVTFNEDIIDIDPAVIRPGRCLGVVKFEEFSQGEALKWLELKSPSISKRLDKNTYSLAELYLILNGHTEVGSSSKESKIGFI